MYKCSIAELLTVPREHAGLHALPAVHDHAPVLGPALAQPAPPPALVAVPPHPRHSEVSPGVRTSTLLDPFLRLVSDLAIISSAPMRELQKSWAQVHIWPLPAPSYRNIQSPQSTVSCYRTPAVSPRSDTQTSASAPGVHSWRPTESTAM